MSTQERTLLQEKHALLVKKDGERKAFWDARDKKLKESDAADLDLSTDDKKKLDTLYGEIKDLTAQVVELEGYQAIANGANDVTKTINGSIERPSYGAGPQSPSMVKSVGQEFVDNPEFKAWVNRLTHNGTADISDSANVKDGPTVELKGLVLSSATSGGALVRRDYGPTQDFPLRPRTILDAITILRTGSNLVEYVRVTGKTRAAAVVPEATATTSTGYSDAAKPESSMALAIIQAAVKTIAVWMPATRQILSDAPQLQSMIDNFLDEDLHLELEEEIITGVGGATQFTGIENTAGLTPQAFVTDVLTTTRKARTAAMITGRTASTGYLMNPYDWEALDLTKDAENRYYFGGPLSLGQKQLWGLPVFESEVIPIGTAYTGNLKTMVLWDREKPSTRIAEQHADYFTHNMIAILTELRAAFGVLRPASLVKIDMFSGVNS